MAHSIERGASLRSSDEFHGVHGVAAQYHINREDEFVALRFDREVALPDVYELCRNLLNDPEFDPHWPQLVDVRTIDLQLTPGAMRPFLRFVTSTYRPRISGQIAVVLDGSMDDAFCAGVYRFVCRLSDAEAFDDYAMAIKWLLRNGWRTRSGSSQPQNADGHHSDEQPKQIRA